MFTSQVAGSMTPCNHHIGLCKGQGIPNLVPRLYCIRRSKPRILSHVTDIHQINVVMDQLHHNTHALHPGRSGHVTSSMCCPILSMWTVLVGKARPATLDCSISVAKSLYLLYGWSWCETFRYSWTHGDLIQFVQTQPFTRATTLGRSQLGSHSKLA